MTADVNVTAKLAEWEALVEDVATAMAALTENAATAMAALTENAAAAMAALLAFVREVRAIHREDSRFGECALCGERWPCPIEEAAWKWIGGGE